MTGAPAVGVAQQKTISQSSLGRHHLPGIKQLATGGEEVFAGISHCWRFCRNKHWYSLESKLTVSAKRWITPTAFPLPSLFLFIFCSSPAFFFPPVFIHYCKYFFVVWLRAGLFSKREPNGLRRSQRNCLSCVSAEGASSGLQRQTRLKPCLPDARRGLFKSARAPDGWGLRHKTILQVAGCAHIPYKVS